MRVTVTELPHEAEPLTLAWAALCAHTSRESSDVVVLPELAFAPPVWEAERFDLAVWTEAVVRCDRWLARFPELGASLVIGARPVTVAGSYYNEGFVWSPTSGYQALRRKYFLPDESGGWEARWFTKGDAEFPAFTTGTLTFGLNICTELWALDTYAAYARCGVDAVIAPRATAAATTQKWLAVGTVAAVRSGAYGLSSNRVHPDGSCGGVGWIIDPDGRLLASTCKETPYCTLEIDPDASRSARKTYPRYVFGAGV